MNWFTRIIKKIQLEIRFYKKRKKSKKKDPYVYK